MEPLFGRKIFFPNVFFRKIMAGYWPFGDKQEHEHHFFGIYAAKIFVNALQDDNNILMILI